MTAGVSVAGVFGGAACPAGRPPIDSPRGVLLSQKIRIYALAKELGLDNKELIEHAARAGVEIKNSALASISPEERDQILAHMKSVRSGPTGGAAPARAEAAPPRRDAIADRGRVRAIEAPARPSRPVREAGLREEAPADVTPEVAAEAAGQV
ncbi:MAG TPA: translation initiation factor IF-2 N-terminal domain-containing protein, partial [Planctomycetaceae bacterium]